jgi:hypothetical protein
MSDRTRNLRGDDAGYDGLSSSPSLNELQARKSVRLLTILQKEADVTGSAR